jgi:hypothetical protein
MLQQTRRRCRQAIPLDRYYTVQELAYNYEYKYKYAYKDTYKYNDNNYEYN